MNFRRATLSLFATCALLHLAPSTFAQASTPEGVAKDDWSGIRAAYDAGRHRAFEAADGFQFHNPGQRWTTDFDGLGFLVQPDSGTWSWGLQLQSFGFEGAMQEDLPPPTAAAEGDRVAYDWNENVQEWYINDARGLEHGYTLQSRPEPGPHKTSPLVFNLAVRGSLDAKVMQDGKGVRFVGSNRIAAVTYAGLRVFDATGKDLAASFTGSGADLCISIQESSATYPITIDPIARQAYLKASTQSSNDRFGTGLAASGNLVVVGAPYESSNARGINGPEGNNWAYRSGAAYIFENNGGIWTQLAYVKSSNSDIFDGFGGSVAISGDTIVIGAPNEQSSATGVNGDQTDNTHFAGAGAAYVFQRIAGVWTQQAYLKASNTDHQDKFGLAVAICGDTIVVGNPWEASQASGINGNQSDNSGTRTGAVYTFERTAGTWAQTAYIKASNPGNFDDFGSILAMTDDRIAIGAYREDSNAAGINGDQANNSFGDAGAVYMFERTAGVWAQDAYIKASNPQPFTWFGGSLALSGDRLLVGSPLENSDANGINGDESDTSADNAGAAYLFQRTGGTWVQEAYMKASNSDADDAFGAVAIRGNRIVIGAAGEASAATGIDGNQSDNSAYRTGAAYVFEYDGSTWTQQAYLKGAIARYLYQFGGRPVLTDTTLLVAAVGDASTSNGINGDPTNTGSPDSGAVFVFDLHSPTASYCEAGTLNSTGLPASMAMAGTTIVANNDFTLRANNLPTDQFGYFLNSPGRGYIANVAGSQGTLCLGGGEPMGRHNRSGEVKFSGSSGSIRLPLDLTNVPSALGARSVVAGETWNFQCWYRDMNPGNTSNFTDGLSVLFD